MIVTFILALISVHTGTDIAVTLGISRTAVWKVIQRLKKYSIDVRSQHQGYQLNFPLLLLDTKRIEDLIENPKVTLEIFETIPSTSDYLRDKPSVKNLCFCLAEHMSKGRGRLGRSWAAPFGRNIYLSFSYMFNKDISEISGLSLVIGILVVKALDSLYPGLKPLLKWPNDIYIDHKKGGGILIDIIGEAHGSCKAIIGVAVNVNMKGVDLKGVDQPWTSLEHALTIKQDRNIVVAQIMQSILKGIDVFLEKGMEPFLLEWPRYDVLEGKKISINTSGDVTTGIARGINKHGYLLLELPSGNIESFACGDTSLLKD
ncbi:MAG: biotin--[acetyl-CoA-carboxylase] ligase [Proteobacteria bacterium]|nr:biotin--[acetyl-CoA-carboxylase] ligase [Pseudomonadota bacterium]